MTAISGLGAGVETDITYAGLADFYRAEYPRLVGMLVLYCGDRVLAEDLAQEAMARACARWRRVARADSPVAWVHRVAINLANSAARRRKVSERGGHHGAEDADREPTAAVLDLRRAVASLPDRQREALVLRYYADLPVQDVAEIMQAAAGTVRALTSQAIASLRRAGLALVEEEAE